jgi:hypothetical protein
MALGAAFAVGSTSYELFGQGGRIGPGVLPFGAGILLIVFGGVVGGGALWRFVRSPEMIEEQEPKETEEDDKREQDAGAGEESSRTVAYLFGLMLVTILFVPILGFPLSFGLLVFTITTVIERESILLGLMLSIGGVVAMWLLFIQFLQVPLPQGLFELALGG